MSKDKSKAASSQVMAGMSLPDEQDTNGICQQRKSRAHAGTNLGWEVENRGFERISKRTGDSASKSDYQETLVNIMRFPNSNVCAQRFL